MGDGDRDKKLRDVAHDLIEGDGRNSADELAADAELLGVRLPTSVKSDDTVWVLPANQAAVQLFYQCQTQWRHGPSGALTGLDYSGCYRVARALAIDWREQFARLTVLEAETIALINQRIKTQERPHAR